MCGRIGVRPLSKFSVQGSQTNWLEYMIQTVKTSLRTWYLSGKQKLIFEIKWSQNCTGVLLISLTACPSPPLRYVPPLLNSCFSTFLYFQVLWVQNWPANRPGCRDSKHEVDALSRRWSSTDGNIQQRDQLRVPQRRNTHTGVGSSASYIPIGKLSLNMI